MSDILRCVKYLCGLLVLLVLLVGCSPTMSSPSGCATYWDSSSFPIIISPDATFDGEDLASLGIAAQAWNVEVGREVFVVVPGLLEQGFYETDGIHITQGPLVEPLLGMCPVIYHPTIEGRLGRVWRGMCIINKEATVDRATYSRVVMHELGHALGFTHTEDARALMYPRVITSLPAASGFDPKHLDAVGAMMGGTYKGESVAGLPSCL